MLRQVFTEPSVPRDYELRLLSYQYATATTEQQLSCSAAVAADIVESKLKKRKATKAGGE